MTDDVKTSRIDFIGTRAERIITLMRQAVELARESQGDSVAPICLELLDITREVALAINSLAGSIVAGRIKAQWMLGNKMPMDPDRQRIQTQWRENLEYPEETLESLGRGVEEAMRRLLISNALSVATLAEVSEHLRERLDDLGSMRLELLILHNALQDALKNL